MGISIGFPSCRPSIGPYRDDGFWCAQRGSRCPPRDPHLLEQVVSSQDAAQLWKPVKVLADANGGLLQLTRAAREIRGLWGLAKRVLTAA